MNNYLKSYPYLFVRESDATDYFCTLCDAFLKEEELQAHLFDGHQAEDCSNYFVRVKNSDLGGQNLLKKSVHICVVCWGKLPSTLDMASHRNNCKIAAPASNGKQQPPEKNNESLDLTMRGQEVTKLVTTPDIQCYEDMEGPDTSCNNSKGASPPPPPNLTMAASKRGRKKQLHPQQLLTPDRLKEVVNHNLVQCGLCEIVIPSSDEAKHLQEWHRLTVPLDNTNCPLCTTTIPLLELVPHLTIVHSVTPPATGHALLLWILTANNNKKHQHNNNNNNTFLTNQLSAMLMQSMLKTTAPPSGLVVTPPTNSAPPLPPPAPTSFLQSLLNGESPPPTITKGLLHSSPATPPIVPTPPPNMENKLEHVVAKLTRKHMGINARESYQCQVCSKWFAVPPIKHLRGHLVAFKEEQRPYIGLINNNGYACLTCFHIAGSPSEITDHMTSVHAEADPRPLQFQPQESLPEVIASPVAPVGRSSSGVVIADPKGVELDNAGRVKSGKVRKQCELCGQWSNIKWFFKHMSEMHNALFCRCCREYLPIHEQEEHRRFHAEPPYMGQKIRIENGQPIIIDRKERASLTPIGSLAAWGGSSGGMVVKAIDDGTSQLISRKRKGAGNPASVGGSPAKLPSSSSALMSSSKDTLMPKETCPVCGIQITYKNLARHIKLRHKIKYKFCHKCRKFVPNDTYEDHRVTCVASVTSLTSLEADNNHDSVDASDYMDMDGASALVINTDDNEDSLDEDSRSRSNTSKNKLESLLGKEFKHPRRKCGICGYMVSYSNYKRHLKNAHPNVTSEDVEDMVNTSEVKYLGHQMDEEDLDEDANQDYAECHICGDHIMKEFLDRHLKMNHVNEADLKECPVCSLKMRLEGVVKHCKAKHKVTYKYCRPCGLFVVKKQFRGHILSSEHKEAVNLGEKHSSHEDFEDDEDEDDDVMEGSETEKLID